MSAPKNKKPAAQAFLLHLRDRIFQGFLAVIPIAITFFVLRFLYLFINETIMGRVSDRLGMDLPGLGIVILLAGLYFLGLAATNVAGRQLLHLFDRISIRIPVVKTLYQAGKQVATTLALSEKRIFQRVVLVRLPGSEQWTPAFVIGDLEDLSAPQGRLQKVLVPIAPNPASGFVLLVPDYDLRDPGWTVEEGLKMIVTDGLVAPDAIISPRPSKD